MHHHTAPDNLDALTKERVDSAPVQLTFCRSNANSSLAQSQQALKNLSAGKDAARAVIETRTFSSRIAAKLKPAMEFLQNIKQAIMKNIGSAKGVLRADAHQTASSTPELRIREYKPIPDFEKFENKQQELSQAIDGREKFFKAQKISGKEALASLLIQSNAEISGLKLEEKHLTAGGWAGGNRVRTFASHLGLPNLLQHLLDKTGPLKTNTQLASTQIALCRIAAAGVSNEFLANFDATVSGSTPENFGDVIEKVQRTALDEYLKTSN